MKGRTFAAAALACAFFACGETSSLDDLGGIYSVDGAKTMVAMVRLLDEYPPVARTRVPLPFYAREADYALRDAIEGLRERSSSSNPPMADGLSPVLRPFLFTITLGPDGRFTISFTHDATPRLAGRTGRWRRSDEQLILTYDEGPAAPLVLTRRSK